MKWIGLKTKKVKDHEMLRKINFKRWTLKISGSLFWIFRTPTIKRKIKLLQRKNEITFKTLDQTETDFSIEQWMREDYGEMLSNTWENNPEAVIL